MSNRITMARVVTVARREFIATVARPAFLATLILMPLMMGLIGILPAVGIALSGGTEQLIGLKAGGRVNQIGIVDEANVIHDQALAWHNKDQAEAGEEQRRHEDVPDMPEIIRKRADVSRDYGGYEPNWRLDFVTYPDRAAGEAAIQGEEAAAVYVIEADWMVSGEVTVLVPEQAPMSRGIMPGKTAVARLLRASLSAPWITDKPTRLRLLWIMDATAEHILPPGVEPEPETEDLDELLAFIIPLLFTGFFSISIFVASGYLLDGIGEEKESRVLEVLLASLTPEELLAGKIVGLGAAGVLQASSVGLIGLAPMLALGVNALQTWQVVGMLACAGLGYAEYASLMAASGAVAGNRHEGRQISAGFSLLAASPMFLIPVFMTNPDGTAALVMSLFPPTAPIAMILRLGLGEPTVWQIVASLGGMVIAGWLSWRLGSRVFRVAILMTGARPKLGQIWAWVRGG